jgi:hypothetical protein
MKTSQSGGKDGMEMPVVEYARFVSVLTLKYFT